MFKWLKRRKERKLLKQILEFETIEAVAFICYALAHERIGGNSFVRNTLMCHFETLLKHNRERR